MLENNSENEDLTPTSAEEESPPPFYQRPIFRWAITLLLIGVIAFKIDLSQVVKSLGGANGWWVLIAILVALTEQTLIVVFWRLMLKTKGYEVPLAPMLQINFVSNFIGFAIPSGAGPDISKVYGLSRYIKSVSEALSSLVIMRLFSLLVLFGVAFSAFIIFRDLLPVDPQIDLLGLFLGGGLFAMVAVTLFSGPAFNGLRFLAGKFEVDFIYHRLERFHNAYVDYVKLPSAIFVAFLAGAAVQLNGIIVAYLLAKALGLDIEFATLLIFIPVTSAIAKIPVTFGGIGLREGSYVLLFGYIGVSPSHSVALSLLTFAVILFFVIGGGIIYWLFGAPEGKSLNDFAIDTPEKS